MTSRASALSEWGGPLTVHDVPRADGVTHRVTLPMCQILALLLEQPRADWYGLEIAERTGLGSGVVAEVLYRFELWDWVMSRWEDDAEARSEHRARRRYYQMNSMGISAARQVLKAKFPGATFPEGAPA